MAANSDGPSPWGNPGGGDDRRGGNGQRPPGGGGPWGPGGPFGGGGGGGRPGPGGMGPLPDLDALIARLQALIRSFLGGGGRGGGGGRFTGGRGLSLLGLGVVLLWLASGFYLVEPDELGVVMRFGAYSYRTEPGLHWHLPWPVEHVLLPAVTRINRTEIGYRSGASTSGVSSGTQGGRDVPSESLMLTGDENIIDINLTVFWKISNAAAYLFNTRDPDSLVKAIAESSIREVMGRTPIQPALTQLRAQIETDVHTQTQQILDRYMAGIEITQVQLQRVDPPDAVIESFRDVQRANTDAERLRNEAEAYHNDIVPRARGQAAAIVAEGQGAKQASVAQATGQAQRFDAVLKAYQAAKDVTLQRMYLDTMQDILTHSQPLVVDDRLKGLVPFLPLNPAAPRPAQLPAPPAQGSQQQGAKP
jgi:modulator of FtsH protease HflK